MKVTFRLAPLFLVIGFLSFNQVSSAQYLPNKFGKGLNLVGKDSSFSIRFGLRFQTLMSNNWVVNDDELRNIGNHSSSFLLRRSRFKFDGFILSTNFKYKLEFSLSNRDQQGGHNPEQSFTPLYMRDAWVEWNFFQNFSLRAGQGKLPGNRERVISSANMQLVDRSLLNSRFNIDRDLGLILKHHFTLGKQFVVREMFSLSNGEVIGITRSNIGGYDYTFRLELLPFGKFTSKGDYNGGGVKREEKPKLAIGLTYDINVKAAKQRGQLGNFIYNLDGSHAGKTLNTFFADFMFKYKRLTIMGEYAYKDTKDGNPNVYDKDLPSFLVGQHYIGSAENIMVGWMFDYNIELTGRYTHVKPNAQVDVEQNEVTLGLSKYIVGHQLKVQTDVSYRQKNNPESNPSGNITSDELFWRLQLDVHF
jgi:phosphate-selective porin OprO/OprP